MNKLDQLYEDMLSCTSCALRSGCTQVVPAVGCRIRPLLMIVGEAPGADEDIQGEPFVGRAGMLLREVLRETKILNKRNTLISNTIKCLFRGTPIKTEEGNKRLDWIVLNKWDGHVQSVDEQGRLCWKKITGWYKTPIGNRSLFRVTFQKGKGNCKGQPGVTATEDHNFLTKKGWVQARDLVDGDMVATGTPVPGPRAKQLLLASMCGEPEPVITDWRKIKVQKRVDNRNKSVFCIDVEDTHCFVTPGGVVHNCRPPANKFPTDESPSICIQKWLSKEIEIAKPERMLLLGAKPLLYVANMKGITSNRGSWYNVNGVRTMATFHPSYVMRCESEGKMNVRRTFEEDIEEVAAEVRQMEA